MEKDLSNLAITGKDGILPHQAPSHHNKGIRFCEIDNERLVLKFCENKSLYFNEKRNYLKLNNEDCVPTLKYFDDKNYILCMTYVGLPASYFDKQKTLYTDICPGYYEKLEKIYQTLKEKYNFELRKTEKTKWNVCIDSNGVLRIIDLVT